MTTRPTIALAELAEKGPDADLVREMIQYVAQRKTGPGCGVSRPGKGWLLRRLPIQWVVSSTCS